MTSISFRSSSNMTQTDRQTDRRTDGRTVSQAGWPETTQQHSLLVAHTSVTGSLQPTPNYSWQMTLLSALHASNHISFYFRFFRIFAAHLFHLRAMLYETGAVFGPFVHVCARLPRKKTFKKLLNRSWCNLVLIIRYYVPQVIKFDLETYFRICPIKRLSLS